MDEYKPITGELRRRGYLTEANIEVDGAVTFAKVYFGTKNFRDLCDDIDAVHAQLERENKCLREKVRRQGVQLTEVQGALERRNNGELKRHWQKELDRLKAERDSMAAALDAAQGKHAYAPESHYMMLPKDADGVPIHVGDVMEWCDSGETIAVEGVGNDILFYIDGENAEWTAARNKRHYHKPTVEDILREFAEKMNENMGMYTGEAIDADEWRSADSATIADFAAKLRLAGES